MHEKLYKRMQTLSDVTFFLISYFYSKYNAIICFHHLDFRSWKLKWNLQILKSKKKNNMIHIRLALAVALAWCHYRDLLSLTSCRVIKTYWMEKLYFSDLQHLHHFAFLLKSLMSSCFTFRVVARCSWQHFNAKIFHFFRFNLHNYTAAAALKR